MKRPFIELFAVALLLADCSSAIIGGKHLMKKDQNGSAQQCITITVVFDNYSYNKALETSWGFACVITGLEETILFDTGSDGKILLDNMGKMNIYPAAIQAVVLSHSHWDHVGGLDAFLENNPQVRVYPLKSFPKGIKDKIGSVGAKMTEVLEPMAVCKDVYTTGEMGTQIREQSLVIKSPKGLVIITGCAHPGVVEIVKKAKDLFQQDVYLVLGGFHLKDMSEKAIKGILSDFRKMAVHSAGPSHCTGDLARSLFKQEYGPFYVDVGVGKTIDLD